MFAQLKKFRVTNFRSVEDSGWLDAEETTCFVGTNEAGKTNVLIGLWKLNPANDEPIIPLADYPRKKYVDYKATKGNELFIEAIFDFDDRTASDLANATGWNASIVRHVKVGRQYNGSYVYSFPYSKLETLDSSDLRSVFTDARTAYVDSTTYGKETTDSNQKLLTQLAEFEASLAERKQLSSEDVKGVRASVQAFLEGSFKRKVNINEFFQTHVFTKIDQYLVAFGSEGVSVNTASEEIIRKNLPTFVYYSDYGNLDSEIYLPHVIDNFERKDLGERERAKARSLKVLFEFVKLSPKEILELGKEDLPRKVITINQYNQKVSEEIQEPDDVDIEKESKQKKEREVLLRSASTKLTGDFAAWWKQGNYIFRFQADGNHFRIWVSDDKRAEEIELEGRSRGLQWFFSFFLTFLVESKDSHSNCILLLDEPGLSLHPIAQMDLIRFFNSLAQENQLLYTTHSPFLVDANSLSNIKAMYVGDDGRSVVSSDLRSNERIAEKSIYPIHAAIGISVSDTLLLGCQPVLLEGPSDQIYLQLIKKFVLSEGKYRNNQEIVFIPTGGVRGMSPVIKILLGRDNDLPFVVLDSDKAGMEKAGQLRKELYKNEPEKVLTIDKFIGSGAFEIEDLMPKEPLARTFAKLYRRKKTDDDFDYSYDAAKPIVDQMEAFARANDYTLELGWKVTLAREFQRGFDRVQKTLSDELKLQWVSLFDAITSAPEV
ncbi:MAG: ATP-dependent nuclease [Trueperaceae bacterium]